MLSFHFTHKNVNFWKCEYCVFIIHLTFYTKPTQFYGVILAYFKGGTQTEGVREQGAEENILAKEG
jgi:hypothetical protein